MPIDRDQLSFQRRRGTGVSNILGSDTKNHILGKPFYLCIRGHTNIDGPECAQC